MATSMSSGLKKVLLSQGLSSALSNCVLTVWSGPIPQNADTALVAENTKLLVINASNYLSFTANTTTAMLEKPAGDSLSTKWFGTASGTGTGTFFRIHKVSDTGSTGSTSAVRFQGTIGSVNSTLNMNPSIETGKYYEVNYFAIGFPI